MTCFGRIFTAYHTCEVWAKEIPSFNPLFYSSLGKESLSTWAAIAQNTEIQKSKAWPWMKETRDNTSGGGGLYLRCPGFTSVHVSLRSEGSLEYIRLCEGRESLSPNFQTFQDPRHQFHGIGRLVLHSIADPGSRIWCLFYLWIRDPGWIKSRSGSRIWNEQPGSYFLELRSHFLGLKYLNSFMRSGIRNQDGKNLDLGTRIKERKKLDLGSWKTSRISNTGFGNPLSSCHTRTTTYAGGTDSLESFALLRSLKIWALENYICLLCHTFTDS